MRDELRLPELTFPDVKFGAKETPWDLTILLYKGGAAAKSHRVQQLIVGGALGDPQVDRLELVVKLHAELKTGLATGGSRETASVQLCFLRHFFGFADSAGHPLNVEAAAETYCAWADWLFQRTRINNGKGANPCHPEHRHLSSRSAYSYAATVGTLLDRALERHTRIIEMTRLEHRERRKTAVGVRAEKQNLSDTFVFGHLLQDICDELTIGTVLYAPLPLHIKLRGGKTITRKCHKNLQSTTEKVESLGKRHPLANLRIEAELLMFIAQTGMNPAQAAHLEFRHFFYVSHIDGYQVKEHKDRRGGTVLFEIFKDYKRHFERYLEWRRTLFPSSNRLFPFIGIHGSRPERRFTGSRIRATCHELGVPFVSPRSLRSTRVNWLLRKTADPDLTAEMAQHTKQTLLRVYARPSLQRAMVEATRFWSKFDPHSPKMQAVGPGVCTGTPQQVVKVPKEAPKPNCVRASGCLWCENHRDVDSLDYVWALASFGYLKANEMSKLHQPKGNENVPPAQLVITRIHEKLRWFEQSSEVWREWVTEVQMRITEGDFHPTFRDEIAELEGTR
ncbi:MULTISPECIES: site-specific integrase [Burkholderia]|uniref:site-specific integrase n=1 Tax=Burkholderia TaxID=32008 RepID=UPI00084609D7|nr:MULTISPECIES: site-specific integrase [Burkholderia]MBX3827471.1 site-specific integrase [Burkholderia contaminans]MBX3846165.1 site-specific integrase [Burkholderia contaminans]MBX3864427.1 site-specific integrase [Burkholderia contaminans]MBX3872167.1 site-specific integrase [Burkholderia contaminans]MBX3933330.1 site-specific integrase [Burkholderia contaminans]